MNNEQTVERLKKMRISAMAELHYQNVQNNIIQGLTPDEYLAILTDHEWDSRNNRKIQRLIKQADFKQQASPQEINFNPERNLDRNMFNRLITLDFMKRKENIIITGATGVGKSYIGQAIGYQSCFNGIKTKFWNTAKLFNYLNLAKTEGYYLKELKKIQNTDLLILDDFGLQEFDNRSREAFMDIVEDRYNINSTIIISQIPVSLWHKIIGEGTVADAILDRIVNSSHRINLEGSSLRKDKIIIDY